MKRRSPIRWFLIGSSLGAASMYVLDPARGARRRHGIADRTRGALNDLEDLAGKARRDATNRAHGIAARARGAPPGRSARGPLARGTPERRLLDGGVGVLLALWGLARRGLTGTGATVAGIGLIARAAAPRADGITLVQKTITIAAPVEDVFEFWSRFENYPLFMEHVLEVRSLGEHRSHWRVRGPASLPIEWDAETTVRAPNRTLAWRSLEGSEIEHHGEVHFERIDDHTTRISVHMAYRPPAGAFGHAVVAFLHGDPKSLMDDDLQRMKSLLETGQATAHHHVVTRTQLH